MQNYIDERIHSIHINKNVSTPIKIKSSPTEYSLKQQIFYPSKSSPPNEFMIKLHTRMNKYHIDNMVVNLATK